MIFLGVPEKQERRWGCTEETGEFRDKENRRGCGGGVGTETEKQTGEKLGGRA